VASRAEIIAACDAYLAAVSARDPDAVMALYHDDARVEDPIGSEPKVGRDAIAGFYESMRDATGIVVRRIGPVCVVGSHAAFLFGLTVTIGDEDHELCSIDAMVFDDDGKIVSMTAHSDHEAVAPTPW